MPLPRVHLSHDSAFDWLTALEFGRIHDGTPREDWEGVDDDFGFLHSGVGGPIMGFMVKRFSRFDVDDPKVAAIWTASHFEVPLLGLPRASAGEVILAVRPTLGGQRTINRGYFHEAVDVQHRDPATALRLWRCCLEAGDSMAHFALGYTLYELRRYREAYGHLRYYVQIAPAAAWNWCWLGKAAHAIGEIAEARSAYERAIAIGGAETDAPTLLLGLAPSADKAPPSIDPYRRGVDGPMVEASCAQPVLGERFDRALAFAARTHRTQVRKGSGIPYVGHLLGVCSLVIEDGGGEDEAIAALLHDAVEDQGGEDMLSQIREAFGDEVAAIVQACSDTMEEPKPPWRQRKETYLAHLAEQPGSVLLVSLADKLFNARAILRDYVEVGDQLWTRFRAGRDDQLWYYRELADAFERLTPGRMASELADVVDELERSAVSP